MTIKRDLNYLKRIMYHPCPVSSPQLVIETAAQVAAVQLMQFYTWDCMDNLREVFKGKALGRGLYKEPRYEDRPRRGGHRVVPVSGTGLSPGATDHFGAVWNLVAPFEKALSRWFIVGLTVQGVVNWTSLMYAVSGCDLPPTASKTVALQPFVMAGEGETDLLIAGAWGNECVIVGAREILVQPGCYATISMVCQWEPWGAAPDRHGPVQAQLLCDGCNNSSWGSEMTSEGGKPFFTINGLNHAAGGQVLANRYRPHAKMGKPGSLMFLKTGSITITAHGRPWSPIPGGCRPFAAEVKPGNL